MGRRLLYALVAACAMLAAVLVFFSATLLAPNIPNLDFLNQDSINKQKAKFAQELQDGYEFQRDGYYEKAVEAFSDVAKAKPELADVKEAQLQLGQTYFANKQYTQTAATLQQFYDRYANDERRDQVAIMLGIAYRELKQWDKAMNIFSTYAEKNTVIDPYVRYQLGLTQRDAGNLPQAIEELGKAVTGTGPRLFEIDAMEKIAETDMTLKDYDGALSWYDRIRARAQTDGYKSELNYRSAMAYKAAGRAQEAKNLLLANITTYPSTGYALLSLDEINKIDPSTTTYYQEGLVYYLNGEYDKALTSFSQSLASPQETNAADAIYFQGLALQKQGNQSQAIARFDQLMSSYPDSARVGSAWFQKAESQVRAKNYSEAIATYRQFATSLPQHDLAQDARWEAAQLLEGLDRLDEAVREYATLQQASPDGKYADQATFRQGLIFFKQNQYDKAVQIWNGYLNNNPNGKERDRFAFWAGKASKLAGNSGEANDYLQKAIQATPDEYYGFRAKAISDTTTTNPAFDNVRQSLLAPDSDAERNAMVDWLDKWVSPPPTISVLSSITVTVQEDPGFKKGQELLKVGLRQEAAAEFKEAINRFQNDGLNLLQLTLYLDDKGLYQLSIGAAIRVAYLSGERNFLNLPRFMQKRIYPSGYANLVLSEAEENKFDPLLLLAMIRQESKFDKDALSPAEARGLTQVIPSTGEWLAQKLGLSSFSLDDLYRPYLSIRFGSTYLSGLLDQFDSNVFFALAGYNGGPGNVSRWSSNNPNYDLDLFEEDVDYSETQLYLKLVFENYEMYKAVYGSAQ